MWDLVKGFSKVKEDKVSWDFFGMMRSEEVDCFEKICDARFVIDEAMLIIGQEFVRCQVLHERCFYYFFKYFDQY